MRSRSSAACWRRVHSSTSALFALATSGSERLLTSDVVPSSLLHTYRGMGTTPSATEGTAHPPGKRVVKKVIRKKKTATAEEVAATPTDAGTRAAPHATAAPAAVPPPRVASSQPRPPAPPSATNEKAGAATAPAPQKTSMVKSFKLDDVSSACGPHDAIFARRLPTGGCQFFSWPGTALDVAGRAIVSMPDSIRTVHSVFGRKGTPIDLVMDIDCPVPPEYWTMSKIVPFQQKLLDSTLTAVHEELKKLGVEVASQVILQSPNLKKASFHVHTKLRNAAFEDYDSIHGFLSAFQERIPHVDLQIYRFHGMLRMFSCMKENLTSPLAVYHSPRWNIGFKDGKVPDAEAALHSICVREPGSFKRVLRFASHQSHPPAAATPQNHASPSRSGEEDGEGSGSRFHVVEMPLTAQEAIDTADRWLSNVSESEVGDWRSWIGVGICAFRVAYHFKDHPKLRRPALEQLQEAWVRGSQNCPLKFKPGDCETRWATFDPNKLSAGGDWWRAYQRLGRTAFAVAEGQQREAARAQEKAQRIAARKLEIQKAKETAAAIAAAAARRPPPPPPASAAASSPAPPHASVEDSMRRVNRKKKRTLKVPKKE